jgi:hypothetical protein
MRCYMYMVVEQSAQGMLSNDKVHTKEKTPNIGIGRTYE